MILNTIVFRPQTLEKVRKYKLNIVPCESATEEVSFEWSHHRISSTDSKVGPSY